MALSLLSMTSLSSPMIKNRTAIPAAKAPKEDIELQLVRQVEEKEYHENRNSHGQLGTRVEMPAQERNDPGWARPCGEERRCYRHDDERDERQTTDKWVLVGQEHRHPDDGPKFARRPHSDDVRPEIRREHPGIAENRQESPEGGGGEREAHDEGVDGQTGRDEGDAQGQRQG